MKLKRFRNINFYLSARTDLIPFSISPTISGLFRWVLMLLPFLFISPVFGHIFGGERKITVPPGVSPKGWFHYGSREGPKRYAPRTSIVLS